MKANKSGGWTPERLEKFRRTMAAKKGSGVRMATGPVAVDGVKLLVNGMQITWLDALAVHAAVEQLRRG